MNRKNPVGIGPTRAVHRGRARRCLVLGISILLSACGVELRNRAAARELAAEGAPAGSVYAGWRVFQDRCASCHGTAATGSMRAPDLLPIVGQMGPRRFANLVLKRYDPGAYGQEAGTDDAALDALIERILRRETGALVMPAWEDEPVVTAHIADLYAYLSARAEGRQGPGRPER